MKQEQIQYVPIASIEAKPQIREHFDEEALQGLTASISEVGLLQPIRVRKEAGKFVIVSGERRFRSLVRLGETMAPVVVDGKDLNDADLIQRMFIENCQREDLTALEKAKAIAQLMKETGLNVTQVAAKLGLSIATTSRSLALITLPDGIQQMVAAGKISPSVGYQLSMITDPAQQAARAQEAASGGMTRDELADTKKTASKRKNVKESAPASRVTAELGGHRSVSVSAPDLDVELFIGTLDECLLRAKKAKQQNVSLNTLIKMLGDQSKVAHTQTAPNSEGLTGN